jgi:hypothetical protein
MQEGAYVFITGRTQPKRDDSILAGNVKAALFTGIELVVDGGFAQV